MTAKPLPTESELILLRLLWEAGPSTVRDLKEAMQKSVGYTTVLKLLQIMHTKGLVEREELGGRHVYRPTRPREEIEHRMVERLVDQVFDGSASRLILSALGARGASEADLRKIRKLIERAETRT